MPTHSSAFDESTLVSQVDPLCNKPASDSIRFALAAAFCLVGSPTLAQTGDMERVFSCHPGDGGTLTGGSILMEQPEPRGGTIPAEVTTIVSSGEPSNRVDLVFVGDGYNGILLQTYATHVDNAVDALFAEEPFRTYQKFFNVHRVEVTSNEVGVDNDPVPGIEKDTALDMAFWCSGVERRLCIDTAKAWQYASNAPEVDQIWAVANSTKYGGAGYSVSELATFAGANGSSREIAIHEIGHTLGNLEDEYMGDGFYWGSEPPEYNVSIQDDTGMRQTGTKWANWLGHEDNNYGGTVSTFVGAMGFDTGVHRPTFDSKMRTLGQPFNLPSIEGLILEMYEFVDLIDSSTPTDIPLTGNETIAVRHVLPNNGNLEIQWYLDGNPLAASAQGSINEARINISPLALLPGDHELACRVTDQTPFVRNELRRQESMTDWRYWTLNIEAGRAADVEDPMQDSLEDAAMGERAEMSVFPNPASSSASVAFTLPEASTVQVRLYDADGRFVQSLAEGMHGAGNYDVSVDTDGLSVGMYFVHMTSRFGKSTAKFLRVK